MLVFDGRLLPPRLRFGTPKAIPLHPVLIPGALFRCQGPQECVTYAGVDYPANMLKSGFKYMGPRLGFSWLPWGARSRTVVRAGYGVYWYPSEGGATDSS